MRSKALKRAGLPQLTQVQYAVLNTLRNAMKADYPFIPLAKVDKRTIRTLFERDWIAVSPGLDGTRYKITGRGLKALKVYEAPSVKRADGLCPSCGTRERKIQPNGIIGAYCDPCTKRGNNRQYHMKGHQYQPGTPCSRCKSQPRKVYPSGFMITYCEDCRREMRKDEKRRKIARLLEQLETDHPPMCIRCKEAPRYSTGRTVYDYCHQCYRNTQNEYVRRMKGAA